MKKHMFILLCGLALCSAIAAGTSRSFEDKKDSAKSDVLLIQDSTFSIDSTPYMFQNTDFVKPEVLVFVEQPVSYVAMATPKTVRLFDLVSHPLKGKWITGHSIRS